ncbi:BON domain-containing protein [Burkholderia sp. Ac-20353]|nr:BON domain-containing protein [Burkholderia sp. Ac-20353]
MKLARNLKVLVAALALVAVTSAYAQGGETAGAVSPGPASTPDKKVAKAKNRRLQKAVIRALSSARGLNATNIAVIARHGEVTLHGSVVDARQADVAAAVAGSVSGVSAVKNDLMIRPE